MNDVNNPSPLQNPFIDVPQNAARRLADRATKTAALGGVLLTMSILAIIFIVLIHGSWMALSQIGWHFFTTQAWNPVPGRDKYGVLSFLYGTGMTTFLALLFGVPLSMGTAVFITRIAPRCILRNINKWIL